MFISHRTFYLLAFGISAALLAGCFPAIIPTDVRDTTWTLTSETIEPIIKEQSLPGRIKNLKGAKISINLNDGLCLCSKKRRLKISVSEVDTTGIKGYEIFVSDYADWHGNWYWKDMEEDQRKACSDFVEAAEAIYDAGSLSRRGGYYFKESFELIWEAERALGPLECDPVRSIILADKANEIAKDEGPGVLGDDVSGNYESEISGDHPVITMLFGNSEGSNNPWLSIKQNDNKITGTDRSGTAVLLGSKPEKLIEDFVEFKFSYPTSNLGVIEGQWEVIGDGSRLEGRWHDPDSNSSGDWNLFRIDREKKAGDFASKGKHKKKFFSRKSAVKIKWNYIDNIVVPKKDVDWGACIIGPGQGACVDL